MPKSYKLSTIFLILVALGPLMVAYGQMFDSEGHSMFFHTQDLEFLDIIWAHGWYIMYSMYIVVNKLSLVTGIEPKLFFNGVAVVSIIGLSREVYEYFRNRFDLDMIPACIGAWAVLAFPIWHVAFAAFFVAHLFCFWFFMMAVNLREKHWFLALLALLVSLNLFSLFPFAVGIACVEFIMTATKDNYLKKGIQTFVFCSCLVLWYVVLTSLVSVHGESGSYNTIDFRFRSLLHYGILGTICTALWFGVSKLISNRDESQRLLKYLLSFLTLCFFAAFAYWAVDRPLRYFNFGSYASRHTLLTVVPYSLFIATVADLVFKRWGEKILHCVCGFILTASIVLLYQGYDHKVAALLFKDMLVYSLRKVDAPPSGYVSIAVDGFKAPRHVHNYSINMCFYRAYGRAAWMASGFWARRGFVYDEAAMRELYSISDIEKKRLLAFDVTGEIFSKYTYRLENYCQEGRLWYWYSYLFRDYSYFSPQITKM